MGPTNAEKTPLAEVADELAVATPLRRRTRVQSPSGPRGADRVGAQGCAPAAVAVSPRLAPPAPARVVAPAGHACSSNGPPLGDAGQGSRRCSVTLALALLGAFPLLTLRTATGGAGAGSDLQQPEAEAGVCWNCAANRVEDQLQTEASPLNLLVTAALDCSAGAGPRARALDVLVGAPYEFWPRAAGPPGEAFHRLPRLARRAAVSASAVAFKEAGIPKDAGEVELHQAILQLASTGGGWPPALRLRLLAALDVPCEAAWACSRAPPTALPLEIDDVFTSAGPPRRAGCTRLCCEQAQPLGCLLGELVPQPSARGHLQSSWPRPRPPWRATASRCAAIPRWRCAWHRARRL